MSLHRPARSSDLNEIVAQLMSKGVPPLKNRAGMRAEHLVFVPEVERPLPPLPHNVQVIEGDRVFSSLLQQD